MSFELPFGAARVRLQRGSTVSKIREVYTPDKIRERIVSLGREITADYANVENLVVIGVMKGAIFFLADLVRNIRLKDPLQIEFVRLSSYGSGKESSGVIQTPMLELPDIRHRHILIVEDIIDSGRTAKFFLDYLKDQFDPASLKIAVFLDKPSRRVVPVEADYVGFTIKDFFVVGYGLDYDEQFRELPFLGELLNGNES